MAMWDSDPDYIAYKKAQSKKTAAPTRYGSADTMERAATAKLATPTTVRDDFNVRSSGLPVGTQTPTTPQIDPYIPRPPENYTPAPSVPDVPFQNANSFGGGWDLDLNERLDALSRMLGINMANYDEDEQQLNLGWQNKLRMLEKGLSDRLRGNSVRNADRGLTQSGIALDLDNTARMAADENRSNAQQGFSDNIGAIARKKLAAEAEYNLNRLNLQSKMKGL